MIRFGVVGTNWITEDLIKAAQETEQFQLTAVYSRTEERAAQFAEKYRIPHRYNELRDMADSGQCDAVYIASPNSFHAEQAMICMDRGLHVLCEKPMASNSQELRSMLASARKNDVLLMEAMKPTLFPNFAAIREHLPKIGRVRRYFASYCQYSSRYDAYKQGTVLNAFNPVFSNGSLMDLGIYCLYPLVVLFGKPDRIQASGMLLESGVDGQGSLLLTYGGMDAVIQHSKIANSYVACEIQGENGTMQIDRFNQPSKVEIRYRDGSIEDLSRPQAARNMIYEVEEFIRLINAGERESAVNSHANSLAVMEIMDEARRQIGLVFPADVKS